MEYRILGKTGLEISRLGFGGIPMQKTCAKATKNKPPANFLPSETAKKTSRHRGSGF